MERAKPAELVKLVTVLMKSDISKSDSAFFERGLLHHIHNAHDVVTTPECDDISQTTSISNVTISSRSVHHNEAKPQRHSGCYADNYTVCCLCQLHPLGHPGPKGLEA